MGRQTGGKEKHIYTPLTPSAQIHDLIKWCRDVATFAVGTPSVVELAWPEPTADPVSSLQHIYQLLVLLLGPRECRSNFPT